MKLAFRAICAIAAVGAIMAIFGAVAPARGYVSADMPDIPGRVERPDVIDHIDCGSLFGPSRWSTYDGCEGSRFNRVGYLMMGTLVALLFGLVGLGMWASMRRRARDRRLYGRAWNQF